MLKELTRYSKGRKADIILSDMLSNTSGNRNADHFRSMDLSSKALSFCQQHLRTGGRFLCKYLRGEDEKLLMEEAKKMFLDVKVVKPKASRQQSSEMYLLAMNKKRTECLEEPCRDRL